MLAGRSSIARVQRIPVVALHRAGTRVDDLLLFAPKRHGKRDGRAAVVRRYKVGTARLEDHGRHAPARARVVRLRTNRPAGAGLFVLRWRTPLRSGGGTWPPSSSSPRW